MIGPEMVTSIGNYSNFYGHASEVSRANTLYDGGLLNLGFEWKKVWSVGLWMLEKH